MRLPRRLTLILTATIVVVELKKQEEVNLKPSKKNNRGVGGKILGGAQTT